MSPRQAGAALLVLSAAAGIAGGRMITDAGWALAAPFLLTAATIGMALGALWLRRRSWDDPVWPREDARRPEGVRMRRTLLITGVLTLALLPLALAMLVLRAGEGALESGALLPVAALTLVYGAGGVWLIHSARASASASAPRDSHTRRPDDAAAAGGAGWRVVGPRASRPLAAAAFAPFLVLAAMLPWQLINLVSLAPWGIAIWVVVMVVAIVVAVVLVRRASPRVELHAERGLIRAGGKSAGWGDLTHAELVTDSPGIGSARTLILTLHDDEGLRAPIVLRRREDLALSAAETELVVRMIEHSSIALPRAKEDPHGRFSRQLYPTSLTKDDARAVAVDPPGMNDPLPIG